MRERSNRPDRQYAAIPNALMRDDALSIEARGLMALLMTYADDWVFRKDHLMSVTGMGRDKFERAMGELREAGYVELTMTRDTAGKMLGKTWVIRDEPTHRSPENPGVGTEALKNRPPAEPSPGKSAPIRKPTDQEDQKVRTPIPPEGADDLFSEMEKPEPKETDRFDEFWKVYPKKVGKPAAKRAWAKAVKKSPAETIIARARRYGEVADPQFTKHPQGWLNDERWNDDALRPASRPVMKASDYHAGGIVR